MPKGSKKTAASKSTSFFGIMLDHEVDSARDYWPLRNKRKNIEDLKKLLKMTGNVSMLPVEDWDARLKMSKTLSPEDSKEEFPGGIYLFTYVGGP